MMRCTRCRNYIQGQYFNLTPSPSIDWTAAEMPDFPAAVTVEMVISCRECLTPDELAKECAPIALFVVEQMMREAHTEGRVGSGPLTQALHHVRAKLLYGDGWMARAELQRRARASLAVGRPMTPAEAKARCEAAVREMNRTLDQLMFGVPASEQDHWRVYGSEMLEAERYGGPVGSLGPHYIVDDLDEPEPNGGPVTVQITRVSSTTGAVSSPNPSAPVLAGGAARQRDWIDGLEKELEIQFVDSWVCTNHAPGFEITYPATTATCEVCGQGRA